MSKRLPNKDIALLDTDTMEAIISVLENTPKKERTGEFIIRLPDGRKFMTKVSTKVLNETKDQLKIKLSTSPERAKRNEVLLEHLRLVAAGVPAQANYLFNIGTYHDKLGKYTKVCKEHSKLEKLLSTNTWSSTFKDTVIGLLAEEKKPTKPTMPREPKGIDKPTFPDNIQYKVTESFIGRHDLIESATKFLIYSAPLPFNLDRCKTVTIAYTEEPRSYLVNADKFYHPGDLSKELREYGIDVLRSEGLVIHELLAKDFTIVSEFPEEPTLAMRMATIASSESWSWCRYQKGDFTIVKAYTGADLESEVMNDKYYSTDEK
jgi:hypothetical protein